MVTIQVDERGNIRDLILLIVCVIATSLPNTGKSTHYGCHLTLLLTGIHLLSRIAHAVVAGAVMIWPLRV